MTFLWSSSFIIIKWGLVEKAIRDNHSQNITLLPFQPEEVLPYSFSTGDIGVVSYQRGTDSYMIPSKAYYYLAAALALLVVSEQENELTQMVQDRHCGVHVKGKDAHQIIQAILQISSKPGVLNQYKTAARKAAEELYSRKNTKLYAQAMRTYVFSSQ